MPDVVLSGEVLALVPPLSAVAEDTLEAMEHHIAEALRVSDVYNWDAIRLLYEIYTTQRWRASFDDDGFPIKNFEHYIMNLRGRVPRLSKRWAQQNITAISALAVIGVPLDDLYASSPAKIIEVVKTLDYDKRRNVLRGYRVAGGKETVLRLLEEATDPDVRYTDLRARVRSELHTPETSWTLSGGPQLYDITIYHDDLLYTATMTMPRDLPGEVIDDLKRRLGCA